MKEEQVDILLAAYNGEKYLQQQLDSLRRQLHRDIRVIIHDDGSSDGTQQLLDSVIREDSRFTMSRCRETGLGAAGSFLALLKESNGPCCLCDQDDVWTPDHVMVLLNDMKQMEQTCGRDTPLLVMSDCAVTDSEGDLLHPSLCMHQGWKREALPLTRLLVSNNATGCTLLLNGPLRKFVAAHAQADGIFMHDWFIAQTAAAFGAAWFDQLPLVHYRQHGSNTLGASQAGLVARGIAALKDRGQIRDRLERSYRQAEAFRRCYDGLLSPQALSVVDGYLATQHMTGLKRVHALRKNRYLMQNPLATAAQLYLA